MDPSGKVQLKVVELTISEEDELSNKCNQIGVAVIVHDFRPLFILFILFIFLPFEFNFITLIPFKKNTNDLI